MIRPEVTVMMPFFNANATLPRALASVLAQTCDDWECIIVDDGSVDSPASIIEAANDRRLKLITLPENRGRAVARQIALECARGEFLVMLDADDWMFPSRCADQLEVLANKPELALVSSSMAIVDRGNQLLYVRGNTGKAARPYIQTLRHPGGPIPPHASSMVRMSIAKKCSYSPKYRRAEDREFLLEALLGRSFAMLPKLHYAYAETSEMSLAKLTQTQSYVRDILRGHVARFPIRTTCLIVQSFAKTACYHAAFGLGLENSMIARRSSSPNSGDFVAFASAWDAVNNVIQNVFGGVAESKVLQVAPS